MQKERARAKKIREQQIVSANAEKLFGKRLPANLEAERSVLGAILLNDESLALVSEFLLPKDFYDKAHQTIYHAILELAKELKRIDLVSLQDVLERDNLLEQIGGVEYLLALQEDIPSVGLIEQHAKIIKEKAVLRELIGSATGIITNCYNQDDKRIEAVLDEAEKTIFHIANKRSGYGFTQLDIWLKKTFQHLSEIKSHSQGVTGIATGYTRVDEMTSGLQKSDLVILAGRPAMGKTGIALNIAAHAAQQGMTVGFFSLEMSAEQLTLRLLSLESCIPLAKIRNAAISSDEWIELTNVAAQLAERKLFIDDTAGLNLMELRTRARKLKAEKNVQLLVIDYLQLLHSGKKHENRHQEVSEISRSLKALAKELEIPILALSQLSRAVDSRMDKRPMLSDLRESGAIEQDADVIMFLYRDVVYNPDTEDPGLAELIIGKQRNGPTGTIYLNFIGELVKYEDSDYRG